MGKYRYNKRMDFEEIILVIREELKRRKTTAFRAAIDAGLPENAIRYILEGREPKARRLIQVCNALGLEFYVGLPRPHSIVKEEDTQKMLKEILSRIPQKKKSKISEATATYDARHVPVFEVNAAAGGGSLNESEQIVSYVAFRPDWLKRHGLDPNRCAIIRVKGESMEPTLLDQSAVLVDRNRQRRHTGRIYVVRVEDMLLVKRLTKDQRGNWQLVSDNPEWGNTPFPTNAEIVGEVKWSGKTFA